MGAFDDLPTVKKPTKGAESATKRTETPTGGAFDDLPVVRKPKAGNANNSGLANLITGKQPKGGMFGRLARNQQGESIFPGSATIGDFIDAAGHHVANLPHGVAQLAEEATLLPTSGVNLLPRAAQDYVRKVVNQDTAAMRQRERNYQTQVPTNAGSLAGATVGEVLPWTVGAPEKLATYLTERIAPRGASLLRRIGAGAATGSVIGATQPVTGTGDYVTQKAEQVGLGMGTAGALPIAAKVGGGALRTIGSLVEPIVLPVRVAARRLASAYGIEPGTPEAMETLSALRNAPEYVPGEIVSTGRAIGTPRALQGEKALRNMPEVRPAFEDAQAVTDAARMDVLRQQAGTPEDVTAAVTARRKAAEPYLKTLEQSRVDAAPVLAALDRLQASAKSITPTVKKAAASIRAELESRLQNGTIGGDELDALRQNLRSFLADHSSTGAVGTKEEAALEPIASQIIRTLDRGVPGYRDYLAAYRANSVPINTMEPLQELLAARGVGGLNSSNEATIGTLNQLNTFLSKAGRRRYGLSPEAQEALSGVQKSLQRDTLSSALRSPGSDTQANQAAAQWLTNKLTSIGQGGNKSLAAAVVGQYIRTLAETVNNRILEHVGKGAADSRVAADMIETFLAQHPREAPALLQQYPQWAALLGAPERQALESP